MAKTSINIHGYFECVKITSPQIKYNHQTTLIYLHSSSSLSKIS